MCIEIKRGFRKMNIKQFSYLFGQYSEVYVEWVNGDLIMKVMNEPEYEEKA